MPGAVLVVVTGVPGSGKSTLAAALGPVVDGAVFSLDAIKEELFAGPASGGDRFALRLSAEERLAGLVAAAAGAAVVDIWVQPGRDDVRVARWLAGQPRPVVEVLCRLPADMAVERYSRRQRGSPHLPADPATLDRIRVAATAVRSLGIGPCLELDTTTPVDVVSLAATVGRLTWGRPSRG